MAGVIYDRTRFHHLHPFSASPLLYRYPHRRRHPHHGNVRKKPGHAESLQKGEFALLWIRFFVVF